MMANAFDAIAEIAHRIETARAHGHQVRRDLTPAQIDWLRFRVPAFRELHDITRRVEREYERSMEAADGR